MEPGTEAENMGDTEWKYGVTDLLANTWRWLHPYPLAYYRVRWMDGRPGRGYAVIPLWCYPLAVGAHVLYAFYQGLTPFILYRHMRVWPLDVMFNLCDRAWSFLDARSIDYAWREPQEDGANFPGFRQIGFHYRVGSGWEDTRIWWYEGEPTR